MNFHLNYEKYFLFNKKNYIPWENVINKIPVIVTAKAKINMIIFLIPWISLNTNTPHKEPIIPGPVQIIGKAFI